MMISASHAVYSLRLHIVFVTKYRRKTLTPEMLEVLREVFREILNGWRWILIEFGGEADHVHLLVAIHPALNISTLINNLKPPVLAVCATSFLTISENFIGSLISGTGLITLEVSETFLWKP